MKKITTILCIVYLALALVSCGKDTSKQKDSNIVLTNNNVTSSPEPTKTPSPTVLPSPTPSPVEAIVKNTPKPSPSPTNIAPTPTTSIPTATPQVQVTPSATPNLYAGLVVIDAGHGGNDPGTSANGLVEKEVTLDIAKRLNELLVTNKISTYMIRTEDIFLDHKKRIAIANEKSASLYISIHCDWFNNPSYGGTQTFYINKSDLKYKNLTELQYAKNVQTELIKAMGSNNRGIAERGDLAVTKYAQMPSVLVELGFLSNPTDSANLATSTYRQKVAEGLAAAIKKSLETANK